MILHDTVLLIVIFLHQFYSHRYLKRIDQKHMIQVQSKGQNEKSSGVRRYTIVVNVKYIILTDNNSTTAFNMELILMCKINKEVNIRFVATHYSLEF